MTQGDPVTKPYDTILASIDKLSAEDRADLIMDLARKYKWHRVEFDAPHYRIEWKMKKPPTKRSPRVRVAP